jgi:SPP1 family predicted phage head-tail adaptor
MSRDAGTLDTRILFKEKGTTINGLGEVSHSVLSDLFSVWASVFEVKPIELFLSGRDQSVDLTRFRIRYRTDIIEDYVIVAGGKNYDIEGIEGSGSNDRQWLTITARAS